MLRREQHSGGAGRRTAAEKLAADSPAYPTVQYHRIRLLVESGRKQEARDALASLWPGLRKSLPLPSLNVFLAQRMSLATSLDELLESAPRVPVETLYEGAAAFGEKPPFQPPLRRREGRSELDLATPMNFVCRAGLSATALVSSVVTFMLS